MNEKQIYGVETKAFIDGFGGLVKCVVKRITPDTGMGTNKICVQVTEDRSGYKKGEFVEYNPSVIVPRDRVVRRGFKLRINTQYAWQ